MSDPKHAERLAAALGVPKPFPWQLALLERFLAVDEPKDLPRALDIPTGLGKTAVMAIWLVARAAGARVPRRLVYVVDRRAVVDQATDVASALQELVDRDPDLRADLQLEDSLPISTLRGQHIDNRAWLADPSVCAIVLGTVDMIGSRLLFEGYGVSRRMRPYHAGLLGADVLLVIDESHLIPPFERLVESVAQRRGSGARGLADDGDVGRRGVVPGMHLLSLSATSATADDRTASHTLGPEDFTDPTVAERMNASKRLLLREPVSARDLAPRLADEAWRLSAGGDARRRCIVFCNSRDDAQKVHDALHAHARRELAGDAAIELFVGARRVWERSNAHARLSEHGFLAGSSPSVRPTFVVATSAGEVGVDLDADDMVCDLVTWERMVQRLGRVNRRGKGSARVIVVPIDPRADDPFAERRKAVIELIEQLPRSEDGWDASPSALVALKKRSSSDERVRALISGGSTPPPLHPPLTRAVVEAWSMTSLAEHTGRPEVQPWLRGWLKEEDQTTIVWRTHLPIGHGGTELDPRDLDAFFEAGGPQLAERLETETARALAWLIERVRAASSRSPRATGEVGDESTTTPEADGVSPDDVVAVMVPRQSQRPRLLRVRDISSKDVRVSLERDLRGAVIIVNSRLGGLDQSGLLDSDCDRPALDLTIGGHIGIRVRLIDDPDAEESEDPKARDGWRIEARIPVRRTADGREAAWLLIESVASAPAESEEGRSVAPQHWQLLDEHEAWTEAAARRIAERVGLSREHTGVLALAARLHDEGKRAQTWQRAFGRSAEQEKAGTVYAKTTRRPNLHLLDRYRHELGSIPYAERDPRVQDLSPDLRDLCLHLIAAHHGNARPLLRTDGADEPPSVLVMRAREIALRFCRLQDQWGPWGLAWWEALLRAADQQASRRNDLEGT